MNLEVAYVDQALEAQLAKELKVQKNGTIALVRGTGDDQQVQRIRIGEELSKAERKLKKLDEEVASLMVAGFGGVMTQLTKNQADYINVPQEGPFKEETYKY